MRAIHRGESRWSIDSSEAPFLIREGAREVRV